MAQHYKRGSRACTGNAPAYNGTPLKTSAQPKAASGNRNQTGAIPTMPQFEASDILTPLQLAQRLQVKKSWVYERTRLRQDGGVPPIPTLKVGRFLRFHWPAVCTWLAGQARTAPAPAKRRRCR